MNIYYGIPSDTQINLEEKEMVRRLTNSLSTVPCHARDFTTDNPYPFDAVKGTPSLIHAFNLSKSGFSCMKLAATSRLPLVITCTGLDAYVDIYNPGLKEQLQETLEFATRVIVPFPAMANFLKARLQVNTHFEVISPGVSDFDADFDFPREHFGFSENDRLLILDGGLIPAKNIIFAIHQIDAIIQSYDSLVLVIFDNPNDASYKSKVETEMLTRPWVKMIPRPETELMPFLYKMSEVYLNVSHAEGYNPFLLKAMQAGCPALVSDVHGNVSYVHNEETFSDNGTALQYFTSPGPACYERIHDGEDFIEKLKLLLDNPQKAKAMGERAKVAVQKGFSMQKELYLHLQLYKNLLK